LLFGFAPNFGGALPAVDDVPNLFYFRGRVISAMDSWNVSPRMLPNDIDDLVTRIVPGDAIPPGIANLDEFVAGTDPLTGQIFVNGQLWDTLTTGQKARIYYEELSHQSRILMHGMLVRRFRGVLMELSDLARFNEEFLGAYDATLSFHKALSYAWNYRGGFWKWRIIGEGSLLGYYYYTFFGNRESDE
jgi:hypothetical protein